MAEIYDLLKHRDPFLFVNTIKQHDETIIGERTFTDKDIFFKGHFPDYPIVPGVILIEALAQCGGAGLRASGELSSSNFVLIKVENARFHREVKPGETIRMEIKNEIINESIINQSGKAFVGEEIAARAEWICAIKS